MFNEFKEFAMKGNLVDLAVGFILGGAFATVVKSLVGDILMPALGLVTGGVDFSQLFFVIGGGEFATLTEAQEAGAAAIAYGNFINNIISFLIVALAMFFIVKGMNQMQKQEEEAPEEPEEPPVQEVLLKEIRDLLAKQS
ncbi:MAG: large conductance mechanosensitive channel protein MscL [Pseudomonadota bacterium]